MPLQEQVKTARCDAIRPVRSLHAGNLSAVYVPSVEDEASKVSLRNVLLQLKLYESRKKTVFLTCILRSHSSKMLQPTLGGSHFSFNNFLNKLNNAIPQTLSFKRKIETIQNCMAESM
ncbi:hypothetical protein ACS106_003613 [Escherichia coli]